MEENMQCDFISIPGEASYSTTNRNGIYVSGLMHLPNQPQPHPIKKKRNQPCHPEPGAEVIALSPRTLVATNRFVCEVCNKGFQRDQNLQLHRRGHNLPWKLKKKDSNEVVRKKVYVCPEKRCVHNDPSRALGDLTGIKKHFCRKHGEKKWKCNKCSKKYAVKSDWKAHCKICGTKDYKCDCGAIFSRKDSFVAHKAFCNALTQQRERSMAINSSTFLQQTGPSDPEILGKFGLQQAINALSDLPLSSIKKEKEQTVSITRSDISNFLPFPPMVNEQGSCNLTPSSSVFPFLLQNQDYHHHQNPSSSVMLLPTSPTELLQKSPQMGEKDALNSPYHAHLSASDFGFLPTPGICLKNSLSTCDEFIHGLDSYGNYNSRSGFEGMLNSPTPLDFNSRRNHGEGDDNMTRDFLGLQNLNQGHYSWQV